MSPMMAFSLKANPSWDLRGKQVVTQVFPESHVAEGGLWKRGAHACRDHGRFVHASEQ